MKQKVLSLIFLFVIVFSCYGSGTIAFSADTSGELVSSVYTVTYSDTAYSGQNTVSGIPINTTVNTFLYNLRKENPDLLINIFSYNGVVPSFYDYISDYNDRRMYITVRENNADSGDKFILLTGINDYFEDDFEKYPLGMFIYNDSWRFNKYRTNVGYTSICEEDGNRFLRQTVAAKSDADYEETTYTATYTLGLTQFKVEKGNVAEMKFRLRRKGGSIYMQLRDTTTSADGHNFRTIHSFGDNLAVVYSSVHAVDASGTKLSFPDGEWVEFRIVFDRQNSDDSKNKMCLYVNDDTEPVLVQNKDNTTVYSNSLKFSSYPNFLWEDFRISFGFSPSDSGNVRAEFDIDDFSFTTNGVSKKTDKLYVYSKDEITGIEYAGALFDGDNTLKLEVNPNLNRTVKLIAAEKQNGTLVGINLMQGTISSANKVMLPLDFNVKSAADSEIQIFLWHNSTLTPLKEVMKADVSKASIAISNGHPRVVADKADFDRIRSSSDATHTEWKNKVISHADVICASFTTIDKSGSYYIGDNEGFQTVANRFKEAGTVLGMAYQITGDKKYSEKLYDMAIASSRLAGWTDGTVNNLTVSYMMEGFSLCYDWCYDAYTDVQRTAIADFATENCLGFAMSEYNNLERGSHTWSTTYTNHNSIPNANFIMGSVAFADYAPQLCETVLYYAGERIKNYLAGLAPDGGWWEGEMYTNLLFSHMAKASETLMLNFGEDNIIADTPFVERTADFQIAVKGPLGTYNFAELQNPNQYCMPEMLWLANRYNRKDVRSWALENINFTNAKNCALGLLWAEDLSDVDEHTFTNAYIRGIEHITLGNGYDADSSWLSVLGGVNMGSHKHLDLGSFIYDYNGVRWATELGLNNYYKGYHCETSKEKIYYRSRSEGHNTLVINPSSEDGGQRMNDSNGISKGEVVSYNLRADKPFAIYDLSTAYSDKADSVKRGFRMLDGNIGFIVRDEFVTTSDASEASPDEVYWFMHTDASIDVSSDGKSAILTQDGKSVKVTVMEDDLEISVANSMTPEPILSELLSYSSANGLELSKQYWNGHKPGDTDTSNDMKKLQIKHTGTGSGTITVMLAPVGTPVPRDAQKALINWN